MIYYHFYGFDHCDVLHFHVYSVIWDASGSIAFLHSKLGACLGLFYEVVSPVEVLEALIEILPKCHNHSIHAQFTLHACMSDVSGSLNVCGWAYQI